MRYSTIEAANRAGRRHREHLRNLAQQIADIDHAAAAGELQDDELDAASDRLSELRAQLADAVLHGPY